MDVVGSGVWLVPWFLGRVARAGRQAVASPVQPGLGGEGERGDRGSGSADEGGMCCLLASVSVTEWKRHGF